MRTSHEIADTAEVTRAAGVVGSATLLSRVLGYVRDMLIASLFGAGMASDAFIAAFRIPNFLRRLFGEGSLSVAVIPVFSDILASQGKAEALRMAGCALRLLTIVLLSAVAISILAAPLLVSALAYGFLDDPDKFTLCVQLTRLMLPYAVFIGLVALCMGVLNALGHFAAPALAPAMLNCAMIGAVLLFAWLSPSQTTRAFGLAMGVLLGGGLQLALQVPAMNRHGLRLWSTGPVWHPAMNQVLTLMGPSFFGAAVYQINTLIICLLASFLAQGSVSYLYYADRLVQFPLGIFAMAIATALLPAMAHQAAAGRMDQLRISLAEALRLVFFIMMPCMAGLIVLREPIVALLFQRGAFDGETTRLTASALFYYGLGLWAFSAVRIVLYAFYAIKDTRTPVRIAVVSILANTVLGALLMGPMRHNGLALALSLSSMVNLGLLTLALRKKLGAIGWRKVFRTAVHASICAGLMGGIVWALQHAMGATPQMPLLDRMGRLLICIFAGMAVYGILSSIFQRAEFQAVVALIRSRKRQS